MDKLVEVEGGPNPIDRHVGLRIRVRRRELGISQERLAETIGLTFQQVQKYERAANRVSASKLWEVARALATSPAYFYEGLVEAPDPDPGAPDSGAPGAGTSEARRRGVQDFLLTQEGLELTAALSRIAAGRLRRRILELVRALAEPAVD